MRRVTLAHLQRQGDQRRTIIKRRAVGDVRRGQGEEIPAPELQRPGLVDPQGTVLAHLRLELLLGKKGLHGLLRQFHAQHPQPLGRQPGEVEALATERHQHPRLGLQRQVRPEALQTGIDLIQMKTDLVELPAFVPKLGLHD